MVFGSDSLIALGAKNGSRFDSKITAMKNIVIITDTWEDKNTNGVVIFLLNIKTRLEKLGFRVSIIQPDQFRHLSLPTYAEIKMSLSTRAHMERAIMDTHPDYIHIATEGSLGLVARTACVKNKWKFTTFYHTRFPEYVAIRFKLLEKPAARYMKWFHKASACTMVSTESLKEELEQKGFKNMVISPLGVDLDVFHKNPNAQIPDDLSHPLFVFMGRIAPEKTIEDFLECDLPGSKMIIGDGPSRLTLEEKYQNKALFTGQKSREELVNLLSVSDVFVFPSRTDTFSLAIIEALACGLPVAAYNVQGPRNIITNGYDGFLGENLKENALKCLEIDRSHCVTTARKYSWDVAVNEFLKNLSSVNVYTDT